MLNIIIFILISLISIYSQPGEFAAAFFNYNVNTTFCNIFLDQKMNFISCQHLTLQFEGDLSRFNKHLGQQVKIKPLLYGTD